MDHDSVETVNPDRMISETLRDAALSRSKVDVAARLMRSAATADLIQINRHEVSITDPVGVKVALDQDVIFSGVDRPWPRAVLNALSYADLIPVIDGGITLDTFADGRMRNGIWRAHTLVPGRPCMACLGQLLVSDVPLDKEALVDHSEYIAGAHREAHHVKMLRCSWRASAPLSNISSSASQRIRVVVVSRLRLVTSFLPTRLSTPPQYQGPTVQTKPGLPQATLLTPVAEHRDD